MALTNKDRVNRGPSPTTIPSGRWDSMRRLLEAVSAKVQAEAVDKSRYELRRSIFSEEAREAG